MVAAQPCVKMPATDAAEAVMPKTDPVATDVTDVALTPAPDAATFIEVAPPPDTGIFPLYDCTATGVNFT